MDFVFCFQVLNRRDSTCTVLVAAAQKLLPVVVQVSNQRERDSTVSGTCHLFWQIFNYMDCCIALSAGD